MLPVGGKGGRGCMGWRLATPRHPGVVHVPPLRWGGCWATPKSDWRWLVSHPQAMGVAVHLPQPPLGSSGVANEPPKGGGRRAPPPWIGGWRRATSSHFSGWLVGHPYPERSSHPLFFFFF